MHLHGRLISSSCYLDFCISVRLAYLDFKSGGGAEASVVNIVIWKDFLSIKRLLHRVKPGHLHKQK